MNILYLSAHSILAYDECSLLQELGHYVFCPDSFVEKLNPGDESLRPKIEVRPEHLDRYREDMDLFHKCGKPGTNNKENLNLDLVKRFDIIVNMHVPSWIIKNWATFKTAGITVIQRMIGQSVANNERDLAPFRKDGLKIIRYSPNEKNIPNHYLGGDALIRFYKDPEEFKGWTGHKKEVITFAQHMEKRGAPCNFEYFKELTASFPRKLFGDGSETLPYGMGKVSFDELKQAMRDYRIYCYFGTWPASICLNYIESALTGIPIVAIGRAKGDPHGWFPDHKGLYEPPDIIQHGVNGFCSDNKEELQDCIKQLLENDQLAKDISTEGRKTAIALFGKETIKEQWKQFLNNL